MGSFFTGICTRAGKTAVQNALKSIMKARGYKIDSKTAELRFTIAPCGKKWHCLKGNQMDFDDFEGFLNAFAAQLNTPMLHIECVDSDFLWLTLHKNGETGVACAGKPYDDDPPLPQREFWQEIIGDFDAFTAILAEKRAFAEEALSPLGNLMGFDGAALLPGHEAAEDGIILSFSRAGVKEKPLISNGPTILACQRGYSPKPYRLNANSVVAMHNFGGPGRGMEVIMEVELADDNLPFEIFDVHIRDLALQVKGEGAAPEQGEFKCLSREGRRSTWRATFPNFQIPEGINPNYRHPSRKQGAMAEFAQTIVFNYRLHITEHLLGLNFHFIPMENPGGAYIWRLEDCSHSPQAEEILQSEGFDAYRKYMAEHNKSITTRQTGGMHKG